MFSEWKKMGKKNQDSIFPMIGLFLLTLACIAFIPLWPLGIWIWWPRKGERR